MEDRRFQWLWKAWRDELPDRMHRPSFGKGAGDLTMAVYRLCDNHYMHWVPYMWDEELGDWMRDQHGQVVQVVDEWVMPAHEGVKRLSGKGRPPLEVVWLRAVLAWNGAQCPCSHEDVVAHLAAQYRVPQEQVTGAVLRAARAVARVVGIGKDATVPQA